MNASKSSDSTRKSIIKKFLILAGRRWKMGQFNRRKFVGRLCLLAPAIAACPFSSGFSMTEESVNHSIMNSYPESGNDYIPGYVSLHQSGVLKARAEVLNSYLTNCRLCPRECEKDRTRRQTGECQATDRLKISSFHPHHGEEKPLSGTRGSGTIFFSHCNMLCVFCLNWEISQGGFGEMSSVNELANMMLALQRNRCHNINLVTPTHYSPQIVSALDIAARRGLQLPLVWNTSGWEKLDILQLLDGVVDIYLADFKYTDPKLAGKYSIGAHTYPEDTKTALLEMHRQTGVARPDPETGLMKRGLMIRHLVMPNNVSGSVEAMKWIAQNLPADTYVNIMAQYNPVFMAHKYPEINRRITVREYSDVVNAAMKAGLKNLDIQGSY